MFNIPCVIFAGGRSSRMGKDKSLLRFGNSNTLTEFQLHRLQKLFKTVYISCKTKDKFNFDANFIEDIKTDNIFAPTTGFVAVYKQLQENSFFALSVDAPFVDRSEIKKIIDSDTPNLDACIAKTNFGIQPMCGIYHYSLEEKFIKMLKDENHKLGFLLHSSNTKFIKFDDESPFLNINYPDQYQKAQAKNR
ncbi:MAG: molybdenum cofactor guanylyltransferase MobA [Campylobacterota bacterium]|nr:molybdenum cofactor guanylyltransferase MobA [Campylobacterota bacterium]